ncbi:hypothetical protein N431DRAFT_377193 [Stipitochalara longipes BDJ]|nr:hypothetical protein N431DRAFT_377193 [Stipitochalara longipes BDJ]
MYLTRGFAISHLSTRQAAASSPQNITSNFVPSPNTRGTLDILFSSIFTTLICAWALQHLNVPPPSPQAITWRRTLHYFLARLLNQSKFLVLTLICPELWIGKAFQDFMAARRSCRDMKDLAKTDGVTWTITHACFANLGGFKFKVKGEPWLVGMLGPTSSRSTISLAMRECGAIDRLPQISAEEIDGLSNTSALGKTAAFVQISWFLLQIITRAAKHLPVSQLEVATLAFVICAILMYLLFWFIPQGITASVEVNRDQLIHGQRLHSFASDLLKLGGYSGFAMHFWPGGICRWPNLMFSPPNDVVKDDGPRVTILNGEQQYCYGKIGLALAGTLFGVIHCLAWWFAFPTSVERIVWRAASLYTGLAFVSWPVSFILHLNFFPEEPGRKTFAVLWVLTLIANMVYAVARASLLVLTLRCLFYLPADAFVRTWADEIPHFS